MLGTYWLSFLAAMFSGAVIDAVAIYRTRALQPVAAIAIAIALVGHVGNVAYGLWRLGQDALLPGPSILVIQTNLPQDNKIGWPRERQFSDFGDFVSLTEQAHAAAVASDPPQAGASRGVDLTGGTR